MNIADMKLTIAGLEEGLEIMTGERDQLQRALDYVLPFVNVDIRDKALQIARGDHQPGAERG